MKAEKFTKLKDEIEEFIAEHERSNPHYLPNDVILKEFSMYKPKHVKKAIKELR